MSGVDTLDRGSATMRRQGVGRAVAIAHSVYHSRSHSTAPFGTAPFGIVRFGIVRFGIDRWVIAHSVGCKDHRNSPATVQFGIAQFGIAPFATVQFGWSSLLSGKGLIVLMSIVEMAIARLAAARIARYCWPCPAGDVDGDGDKAGNNGGAIDLWFARCGLALWRDKRGVDHAHGSDLSFFLELRPRGRVLHWQCGQDARLKPSLYTPG